MKTITKLWIGLIILVILSPIGLVLPEYFKAGDAWGEWGSDSLKGLVGFIPQGLEKLSSLWNAPLPDYSFKGWEDKPLASQSISYIISGIIGILTCIAAILILGRFISKKR